MHTENKTYEDDQDYERAPLNFTMKRSSLMSRMETLFTRKGTT